ncbi:MAG: hypothetical protein JNL06_07450 [Alphaproteobacteria bacterium]|nr:hypothetical protein [Alphaproteobacteria bacterium]
MNGQDPTRRETVVSPLRITCHISAPHGENMPCDDAHPFWVAVDELGDAIVKTLKAAGIDPNELLKTWSTENGSHLTVSSDTPANATYFWVYLPKEPTAQAAMLNTILFHLAHARRALPTAEWNVALGGNPILWADDKFHLSI